MDFLDALRNIKPQRKAILFLGAGFSNAAINKMAISTPSGSQLSSRILDRIQIPGTAPLGLAIDKLREKLPAKDAFEFLCDQLTVIKLDAKQGTLLGLPWTRIYTINVDDIGTSFTDRSCHDATEKHQELNFGDFVYLHGCISNCNLGNFGQK